MKFLFYTHCGPLKEIPMSEPIPPRSHYELFANYLYFATERGDVKWTMGGDRYTYATMFPNKILRFMGRPLEITIALDPFNEWKPLIKVSRQMKFSGGAYEQELFRVSDGALGVMAAIERANTKDSEKTLKRLAPKGRFKAPENISDEAFKKIISQLQGLEK